jgi:hypothetical protein
MAAPRRITANLAEARPVREAETCGVALRFMPTSRNAKDVDWVDEFADLGPEMTLESSHGLGTLLRVMRVARIAAPRPAESFLGHPEQATQRLVAALGHPFALTIVPRSRIRFRAWTEEETVEIDHVVEVLSDETAFLVRRIGHRMPVRVPREGVVRHENLREAWFQIVDIERA